MIVVHIWEYQRYHGYHDSLHSIASQPGFQEFDKKLKSLITKKNVSLMQEFSFWPTTAPRDLGGLFELRSYTLHPGNLLEWETHWRRGLKARREVMEGVGAWFVQIGELNTVHHLWQFADLEERKKRREQSWEIEGWGDTVHKTVPLIQNMKSRVLIPMPWSPVAWSNICMDRTSESAGELNLCIKRERCGYQGKFSYWSAILKRWKLNGRYQALNLRDKISTLVNICIKKLTKPKEACKEFKCKYFNTINRWSQAWFYWVMLWDWMENLSNKGYASAPASLGSYRDDKSIAVCTLSLCIHIHDIIHRLYLISFKSSIQLYKRSGVCLTWIKAQHRLTANFLAFGPPRRGVKGRCRLTSWKFQYTTSACYQNFWFLLRSVINSWVTYIPISSMLLTYPDKNCGIVGAQDKHELCCATLNCNLFFP